MSERFDLRLGDSREVLKTLADWSIDSVVCDPPYALVSIVERFGAPGSAPAMGGVYARASSGFMGQTWDTGETAFSIEFWSEIWRVMKPGAYILAAGGTRTYHRLVCAIEDAGFDICDMVPWLYGSGFPKNTDFAAVPGSKKNGGRTVREEFVGTVFEDGWGTALKPAVEPWVLAQKPFKGTIYENVLLHGTGALNIEGCRIATTDPLVTFDRVAGDRARDQYRTGTGENRREVMGGRWPANVIHDGSDEVLEVFASYGNRGASAPVKGSEPSRASEGHITGVRERIAGTFFGDQGTAARFYYCAKASRSDRNEGLEDPGPQLVHGTTLQAVEDAAEAGDLRGNTHPTVKPTSLMQYLCRLITPPGGTVLDPFMGSGSTGKAAMLEGFRFVGIEREAGYLEIAEARVAFGLKRALEIEAERIAATAQGDLFGSTT